MPNSKNGQSPRPPRPLVVDLDGTLIRGDLLWEALIGLVRQRAWQLFLLPLWLLGGRAHFKTQISRFYTPDPSILPFRREVLDHCHAAKRADRHLILASASPKTWVDPVAEHLGLFQTVLSSQGDRNLRGGEKLAAIRVEIGSMPFDYMGDSRSDAPIWEAAEEAIGLGDSSSVNRVLSRHPNSRILPNKTQPRPRAAIRAMRPHQWAKNALVFVPILLAHRIDDGVKLKQTAACFLLFCMVASAGYIFNDLLDLQSDRTHPSKHRRPIAAGDLPIPHALGLIVGLLFGAFAASTIWLRPEVTWMLGAYVGMSFAYSSYLKQTLLIDVIVLAGLYTHRILTGGLAAEVSVSPWLLAFSAFFFLSLAFVKRYLELVHARERDHQVLARRAYQVGDLGLVENMGLACGFIAVLVLCLFISSADVSLLYRSPELLWLMCPVMFYWIARIWLLARRGELDDDPVLFATRDLKSYMAGLLILIIVGAAASW